MSQLAERYATALYEVTKAKSNTDQVLETLLALKESLEQNKDVFQVLSTPLISDSDKEAVLKSAIGDSVNEELETFFKLLSKNGRLTDLPSIITAYQEKVSHDLGVESGTVKSAVELTGEERNQIQQLIENKLSKKVDLTYEVDSTMLGGIEAKVGSYIFEDSIKSHIQKLNDYITRRVQ